MPCRKEKHPDTWREEKKRRQWLMENKNGDAAKFELQCHLCPDTRETLEDLRAHWQADHPGMTDRPPGE